MFGFRPGLLLSDFRINAGVFSASPIVQQFLGSQPDRFALIVWGDSPNNIFCTPVGLGVSGLSGMITANPNTPPITFAQYGPIVGLAWNVITTGAVVNLHFTELIYAPKGGDVSAAKTSPSGGKPSLASILRQLQTSTRK